MGIHQFFCFVYIATLLATVDPFAPVSNLQQQRLPHLWSTAKDDISEQHVTLTRDAAIVPIPKDRHFSRNPLVRIKAFLGATQLWSDDATAEHDVFLQETGGVWRTRALVLLDSVAISTLAPDLVAQVATAEARGNLKRTWPASVVDLLGKRSLATVKNPDDPFFVAGRKILVDAFGLKSILQPEWLTVIRGEIAKLVKQWHKAAAQNETVLLQEDISQATYRIILKVVLGDDITEEEVDGLYKNINVLQLGMFSIKLENALVRRIPGLNSYMRGKEARAKLDTLLRGITARRQTALQQEGTTPTCVLDSLLLSNLPPEEVVAFAVDNTVLSVFAGYDTTASTLSNVILLLDDHPDAKETIRKELESFDVHTVSPKAAGNLLDTLPYLRSAILESVRQRPAVGGVFRKTTKELAVGKVIVPANTALAINGLAGAASPLLYEKPKQTCPFRFLHAASSSRPEPEPSLFGFGKHMCPGQHLAQLEMTLILQAFLTQFYFVLEPGQDLSASPPFNAPKSKLRMKLTAKR